MGKQLDANTPSLGALADAEADDYTRLRALKAWAETAGREGVSLSTDPASSPRIAGLQDAAINHPDFAERRVLLFALGFVRQDAAARAALEVISQSSNSEKIRAWANGLLTNLDQKFRPTNRLHIISTVRPRRLECGWEVR